MFSTVITLLVAYAGILLLLRVFESSLIFFPNFPGRLVGDWNPRGLAKEDVQLATLDGVKLHAWWIPAEGAEFTFVALHGNAANIANRADVYLFLHEIPVNVLAVEYRGYGKSEGSPGEDGFYLDAQAGYDHVVKERGRAPKTIIAFGQSLGTPVAADLAAHRAVGGVVLEAPFTSGRAVARRVYPFLPGLGYVIKSKFETAAKLQDARVPVLVVHCTGDPVIPFAMGEEVFRQAREPKLFYAVKGYGHEEASLIAPLEYRVKLQEFLRTIQTK